MKLKTILINGDNFDHLVVSGKWLYQVGCRVFLPI